MKLILSAMTALLTIVAVGCNDGSSSKITGDDNASVSSSLPSVSSSLASDMSSSLAASESSSSEGTGASEPCVSESETVDYCAEYIDRLYQERDGVSPFNIGSSQLHRVNDEAVVTAMCYTKHDGKHNPCYVCHQDTVDYDRANKMDDGFLQNEYGFSDFAFTNRWTNLFQDRSEKTAKISDAAIDAYVNTENYTHLAPLLKANDFVGYVPDLKDYERGAAAFDADGFAKDGSGWVAFNYKPLPSTFWPVNGSTDDVLIRLYKTLRQDTNGNYSKPVYQFNLAIVEMAVKDMLSISVPDLDENAVGVDLNGDNVLGIVNSINRPSHYVGAAASIPIDTYLYPKYTEFLHSVRYIGVDNEGNIYNAPRMKELRYMIKERSYHDDTLPFDKDALAKLYDDEHQEKLEGNNLPAFPGIGEKGLDNKMGWWIQGFIEDAQGDLRPQNYEETFFCMGCHTNLGSTFDQAFAFARKVDGAEGWGYIDLKKMVDVPNRGESDGEILTYFKRVGGASEFRAHNSVVDRYFDNGEVNETKVKAAATVYDLITPTREEALAMSKAYKVLVESQDFIHGREGNGQPVQNVYSEVTDETPRLPQELKFRWDMRLDWSKQ